MVAVKTIFGLLEADRSEIFAKGRGSKWRVDGQFMVQNIGEDYSHCRTW